MNLPIFPFVDISKDGLRFLFDLLVGPQSTPSELLANLQSKYALRCLSAYGTEDNPRHVGAFIPEHRNQRLLIDAEFSQVINKSAVMAANGFYPVRATSRGSSSVVESFSVLYEQRVSPTSLEFDLSSKSNVVERLDRLKVDLDLANRTLYDIDIYPVDINQLRYVAVAGDAFGIRQLEPNMPTGITDAPAGGSVAGSFYSSARHDAMRIGWVRPEVVAPYPDVTGGLGGPDFRLLTLWTSSVFEPWSASLDPMVFTGGVTTHASIDGSASFWGRVTEILANGQWPMAIGAKTYRFAGEGEFDIFTIIASPPRWSPLPRSFKTYDPAMVLPGMVLPEHRRLRRGPFSASAHADASTGNERPIPEVPADAHDPERNAGLQRMQLLRSEAEALDKLGIAVQLDRPADWRLTRIAAEPGQYGRGDDGPPSSRRPPAFDPTTPAPPLFTQLQDYLTWSLERSGARLIQFAACKNGELRYARAITHAEEGYPHPSLFKKVPIGSVSKVLTTMALLSQIGTAGLEESIVDALGIIPVASVNSDSLHQTTLALILQHLSGWGGDRKGDHESAWDDMSKILRNAELWQGDFKPGDFSKVLSHATTNLYKRAPGELPAAYANRNFVALSEVVSRKRFGNVGDYLRASRQIWSTVRATPYEVDDIHVLQASWNELVADGDFIRHSRTPEIASLGHGKYRNGLYRTNALWDAGAGTLVLSIVEVARIIASIGITSILPSIINEDEWLAILNYSNVSGLGFGVFTTTDDQGITWANFWHTGMVVGGVAAVLHRFSLVGSYTVAFGMNMESNVTPDANQLMDLIVRMDMAGTLPEENLFSVFG